MLACNIYVKFLSNKTVKTKKNDNRIWRIGMHRHIFWSDCECFLFSPHTKICKWLLHKCSCTTRLIHWHSAVLLLSPSQTHRDTLTHTHAHNSNTQINTQLLINKLLVKSWSSKEVNSFFLCAFLRDSVYAFHTTTDLENVANQLFFFSGPTLSYDLFRISVHLQATLKKATHAVYLLKSPKNVLKIQKNRFGQREDVRSLGLGSWTSTYWQRCC